jgi:hypothetical protein
MRFYEHRSAVYCDVHEQRSAEKRRKPTENSNEF